MDRNTALSALIDLRQILIEEDRPKIAEAIGVGIEALKGDLHCPKCGTIVRDGRQYHDLVYRGEAEKLQLSGETSTNDYIRRQDVLNLAKDGKIVSNTNYKKVVAHINNIPSANDTDCISRADAIAYIDRVTNSGLGKNKSLDYIRKYISALPPVNQKQITGKLESAEIATAESEESTMNQPKSKLDCISRQQAIEAVEKHAKISAEHSCLDEFAKGAVEGLLRAKELLEYLPPVTPTDKVVDFNNMISADDRIRNLPPVTPTERTGEWIVYPLKDESRVELECPECGYALIRAADRRPHFCENCGAKMKGDE